MIDGMGTTSNSTAPAIVTRALVRTFDEFRAVDGIDLHVPRGSFYGFLGPNGAGKSTTIKCLTGLLLPTGGDMEILGLDPLKEPLAVKRQVGVVLEDLALIERLTGLETLQFVGRVYGIPREAIRHRSDELLALMDLADAAGSQVVDYSHGMRKKIALAAALLPAPRLLFLDEPFEGIDAVASRQIRSVLRSYTAGGGTVFLTSHILEIVEKLSTHIGIIHRGCLVAQGSIGELKTEGGRTGTLEELFLERVGADADEDAALDWLS
jgi:ABC-2 type transport system ATP-binding protein